MLNKKVLSVTLAALLVLPCTACGAKKAEMPAAAVGESVAPEELPQRTEEEERIPLDEILFRIQTDFNAVTQALDEEGDKTILVVGDNLKSYTGGRGQVEAWFSSVLDESGGLYDRTLKRAVDYYKEVVAEGLTGDADECREALNAFRNLYNPMMEEFYAFWDGKLSLVADACEAAMGVTEDGEVPKKAEESWNEFLDLEGGTWYQADEMYYKAWRGMNSFQTEIQAAFEENDFDVDAILQRAGDGTEAELEEEQGAVSSVSDAELTEDVEPEDIITVPREEVTPKVLEVLDEYEKFTESYVAFMLKYRSLDKASMKEEYKQYMDQSFAMQDKLDELQKGELAPSDQLYLDEVVNKTGRKMLELYE